MFIDLRHTDTRFGGTPGYLNRLLCQIGHKCHLWRVGECRFMNGTTENLHVRIMHAAEVHVAVMHVSLSHFIELSIILVCVSQRGDTAESSK